MNVSDESHSRRPAVVRLQMAANIAVILACACVGLVALRYLSQPAAAPPAATYTVGERIDSVDGLEFRSSPHTLLMVLREDCHYCQASIPFYRRLTAALNGTTDLGIRLVVASTDPEPSMSAYLKASGVQVDHVVQVQRGALKVPGTPFLFLVDGKGIVTGVWRGMLPATQERELFSRLGLPTITSEAPGK